MATLSLSISVLESSIEVGDTSAQRVLESAFALFHQDDVDENGDPVVYTSKQKLDWIVQHLIPLMLQDKARQHEEQVAIRAAQVASAADAPVFG